MTREEVLNLIHIGMETTKPTVICMNAEMAGLLTDSDTPVPVRINNSLPMGKVLLVDETTVTEF